MNIFYTYLLTLPVLILGDFLFLGVVAKNLISKLLDPAIGSIEFKVLPAVVFYLIYLVGVFVFAVYPGITANSIGKTIILGFVFGFMCYMTYELTNASTIKNWPTLLVFIDIAWGAFITAVTAGVAYYIYNLFS